ncbi:MAG: NAD-dependent epimerase/dehydratase family protein [Planctomycetes bacterium]|nr:NAD-dependent epimerase/dehydratase family protein [Planctomycetota bacterium]
MRAVVTGASGFLGRHIVAELLADGFQVVAGTRRAAPELEALGARVTPLELSDRDALRNAFKNADVVFHVAAKTGVWGTRASYVESNVTGTENVIAACEQRKVRRLVFTSSPSVVFDGTDHLDASNDLPYPVSYLCEYPRTKALAEQLVLAANGRWGLATCALRPHLIFGADDPHLIPRLIARARAGKLMRIGERRNRVTVCAVETAARAHLLAAKSLEPSAPHAGRAYFIGQEQSVDLWAWIEDVLRRVGAPLPKRVLSARAAYALGWCCELAWSVTRRAGEPPMTRFVAQQLATSHSYSMEPARRAFGFREALATSDAVERMVTALRQRA